jgi:hypothetical protein
MTPDAPNQDSVISLELYKSLRAEVASYVEKVPGLWLQKLTLCGGMIAFLVIKYPELSAGIVKGRALVAAAVLAVPVLAVLIDAKILEYGLHARAVSRFIRRHVETGSAAAKWEDYLWGDDGDAVGLRLVRLRSATTVIVTAVPTAGLIVLAGFVMGAISEHTLVWVGASAALGILYVAATIMFAVRIWPSAKD